MPCWELQSLGFHRLDHPELRISLRRREGERPEDCARALHGLFQVLYRMVASGGGRLEPGLWTELGGPVVPDSPLCGLIYTKQRRGPDGVEVVFGVLLTRPEVQEAARNGLLRVLGRLGAAYGYFPFPPWADRDRAPLLPPGPSLLDQAPRLYLHDLALAEVNTGGGSTGQGAQAQPASFLELLLPHGEAPRIGEFLSQVSTESVFALLAGPHPSATALRFWRGPEPSAITGRDRAAHVVAENALLVGITEDEATRTFPLEDGHVALLSRDGFRRLRAALSEGEDLDLPVGEGPGLRLRWLEPGLAVYHPAEPAPAGPGPLRIRGVELELDDAQLQGRISPADLAGYLRALEAKLRDATRAWSGDTLEVRLHLLVDTSPRASLEGVEDEALRAALLRCVEVTPAPPLRGPVPLTLALTLEVLH
ncbi:MAG: hypothetical protein H6741_30845 [Alphaproteobacteria bacterium]|nr:hypothetical protein [Alphaproteobacteria bacterium]